MGDFNEVPEVPMDTALGLNSANRTVSLTDIVQRSIDMRSGNLVVRNQTGKIIELGVQPDGSYNLTFFNPITGIKVAQFGQQTDLTYALAFYDSAGNIISKNIGQTQFIYDLTTGKDIMQIGKLPNGTYGMAVAKPGSGVSDGIS